MRLRTSPFERPPLRSVARAARRAGGPGADWQDAVGNRALARLIDAGAGRSAASSAVSAAGDTDERQAARAERGEVDAATRGPAGSAPRSAWNGGAPLPEGLRRQLEPELGIDLAAVRVHTKGAAAAGAALLGARAFTHGADVAFAPGAYEPDSTAGRRLLRHELTHVAQTARGEPADRIRRFESYEHQDIGDLVGLRDFIDTPAGRAWAKSLGLDPESLLKDLDRPENKPGHVIQYPLGQGGATKPSDTQRLTAGDITALSGDFYVAPDRLSGADHGELAKLVDIMRRQHAHTIANADADVEYEKASGGRYTDIASHNQNHFAIANTAEWCRIHHDALKLAVPAKDATPAADPDKDVVFQRALFTEAAAAHYLTDAFAGGHLFDKAAVERAIEVQLDAGRYVTPSMYPAWMGINPGFLPFANYFLPALKDRHVLVQLTVKNIHDRMGREGFDVTTKKMAGGKALGFHAMGDAKLKTDDVQMHVAQMAVLTARRQIEMVHDGTLALPTDAAGWDKLDAEVLDWLPDEKTIQDATARAIDYIPEAIAQIPQLSASNLGFLETKMPGPVATFIVAPLTRPLLEPLDPLPAIPSGADPLPMYMQYKLRFKGP